MHLNASFRASSTAALDGDQLAWLQPFTPSRPPAQSSSLVTVAAQSGQVRFPLSVLPTRATGQTLSRIIRASRLQHSGIPSRNQHRFPVIRAKYTALSSFAAFSRVDQDQGRGPTNGQEREPLCCIQPYITQNTMVPDAQGRLGRYGSPLFLSEPARGPQSSSRLSRGLAGLSPLS
ncbi:hypothetical protein BDW62DRAFT_184196 [Aspergillus aurantiobrunneus]